MWVGGCAEDADPPSADPRAVVEQLLADAVRAESHAAEIASTESAHTLSIAVREVPDRLDPVGPADPWARRVMDDLVFEGLTRRVPDAYPFAAPALADECIPPSGSESPAASRDVYCHIPTGRIFHDGTPVQPADVLYSVAYWIDPRRGGLRLRHGLAELESVELVDGPHPHGGGEPRRSDPGRWVRVVFSRPEPLALELLSVVKVVPEALHRKGPKSFAKAPVGTGPMKVTTVESERLVLDAVAPAPVDAPEDEVRRIVLRAVPDGAEALTLLRRGEVQILAEVSPAHIPAELAKHGMAPRFVGYHLTPPRFDLLVYNLRASSTVGASLRGAVDDAIPRATLDTFYRYPSRPATAPVDLEDPAIVDLAELERAGVSAAPGLGGLPALTEHDEAATDRAAATLDALGWKLERGLRRKGNNNLRLTLTWDGARGRSRQVANAIRDGLREIGVLVPYATAGWAYIFGLMRKGSFEIGLVRMALRGDADLYPYFHSAGAANISGVSDAALDASLEAFRVAKDRDGRRAALHEISARLGQLRPVTVLHAPSQVMLASRRVSGLMFEGDLPRLDRLGLGPESDWVAGR